MFPRSLVLFFALVVSSTAWGMQSFPWEPAEGGGSNDDWGGELVGELVRHLRELGHPIDGSVHDFAIPYLPEHLQDRVLLQCDCSIGGANLGYDPSGQRCRSCFPPPGDDGI